MTATDFETAILFLCNSMGSLIPCTGNQPRILMRHTMFHKVITFMVLILGLALNVPAIAGNPGAVYTMTNAAAGNEIVIYNRANDGQLMLAGRVETGGMGSGGDPPLEPVDALGAQNPLILSKNKRFLFAVNAGSDEISVLRVNEAPGRKRARYQSGYTAASGLGEVDGLPVDDGAVSIAAR